MKFIEKIGSIEHIYEGDTSQEVLDLYNTFKPNTSISSSEYTSLEELREAFK